MTTANNDGERAVFPMRINRFIAMCGAASRRKADALVAEGRVAVNGETDVSPGRTVNEADEVTVDGRAIMIARPAYLVMNKPRGVVSAVSDARERTVIDLLPPAYRAIGIFPAGRLDMDSEGLLVLTNDGKFAYDIVHPSSCIKKTYLVFLEDVLDKKKMKEWARGVIINGKFAAPLEIKPGGGQYDGRCFRVVLGEGFKREIRLMASAVGAKVIRLKRIGIGGLFLKNLRAGAFREYGYGELSDMISNGGEI
jgi:23S rRNA pseudouridine2605 synthase